MSSEEPQRPRTQQKDDIIFVVEMIKQSISERKVPVISRGDLNTLLQRAFGLSRRRADAEFWALSKNVTVSPRELGGPKPRIPLDKELGVMRIGNAEFFYPLEMIRNYIMTKRLASFPSVIHYLMESDPLADDWIHAYFLEKREYVTHSKKSLYKGELDGVKILSSEKELFPIKLVVPAPTAQGLPKIQIDSFQINAEIVSEYPKVTMVEETVFKKIYHLQLENPLAIGDRFTLRFSCAWPRLPVSPFSYVFAPHIHLRKGVKKEVTSIVSDRHLSQIKVYRFDICGGEFEVMQEYTNELQKQSPMKLSLEISNQKLGEVYIISFAEV